jgi:hypothetical protein
MVWFCKALSMLAIFTLSISGIFFQKWPKWLAKAFFISYSFWFLMAYKKQQKNEVSDIEKAKELIKEYP